MTEINDNTLCVGWRGVRDALAKRDRFHKFLTKGPRFAPNNRTRRAPIIIALCS